MTEEPQYPEGVRAGTLVSYWCWKSGETEKKLTAYFIVSGRSNSRNMIWLFWSDEGMREHTISGMEKMLKSGHFVVEVF